MIRIAAPVLALAAVCLAAPASADTIAAPDITVEHTAFALRLPDGRVLKGVQLQGAIMQMALDGRHTGPVRLGSIKPDPEDPDILRHEFQVQDGKGGWKSACAPNFYGETWGFPLSLPEGHPGRVAAITLTCASGAVGKCVRFGYKPWARGPHGENLVPYHAACVHMMRADYCGDGAAHTRKGTRIDLWDHIGIRQDEEKAQLDPGDPEFEADWSPQGAVCVSHTRWSEVANPDQIHAECPRLAQADRCTEDRAAALGALTFNRSRLQPAIDRRR